MTMRQWRLVINGEVVDDFEAEAAPRFDGYVHDQVRRPRRLGSWRSRRLMAMGWAALALTVGFEVALSVYALGQFGFGWTALALGGLACLVLVVGTRLMLR